MARIVGLSHSITSFALSLSKVLEGTSYYGLRALLILYMTSESLKLSKDEAFAIYGLFASSIAISRIIGAIVGDFAFGNKKSIILGAILQAIGAFCCCISSLPGLYVGLSLVVIGSGLYSPNLIAAFGKQYLQKIKLLDAGFAMFYLAVSIGSFVGVLFIGISGEKYGWNVGFIISGLLMLLSLIPVLTSNEIEDQETLENNHSRNGAIAKIAIALLTVGLFWTIYNYFGTQVYSLQAKLSEVSSSSIPQSWWQSVNTFFLIPVCLVAVIVWTFFYNSQFVKLTIGFLLGALSFALLLFIPDAPNGSHISLFLLSMFFLAVAEVHIAPVVFSVLTQYANRKYLTILMSIAYLPSGLFAFVVGAVGMYGYENLSSNLLYGAIAMSVVGIGLIAYILKSKLSVTPLSGDL